MLAPPLAAAGINASSQKNVTASLESLADALEPFRDLSTDQLSDLVKFTLEYRETGQIPEWVLAKQPKAPKPRAPKPPKAPKISPAEVVAKLRDLQERSSDLSPAEIAGEIQAFAALTGPQLKDVQKEFLGAPAGKTKVEQLDAIRRKIDSFRASRDRVDGILSR